MIVLVAILVAGGGPVDDSLRAVEQETAKQDKSIEAVEKIIKAGKHACPECPACKREPCLTFPDLQPCPEIPACPAPVCAKPERDWSPLSLAVVGAVGVLIGFATGWIVKAEAK